MVATSSAAATLLRDAALAHHVEPQRAVRHRGADVDAAAQPGDHVEVLGERLPAPRDALVERRAGDVLDAFHQLDQVRLGAGTDGREADAAVAHDDGGDAVPRTWGRARCPR